MIVQAAFYQCFCPVALRKLLNCGIEKFCSITIRIILLSRSPSVRCPLPRVCYRRGPLLKLFCTEKAVQQCEISYLYSLMSRGESYSASKNINTILYIVQIVFRISCPALNRDRILYIPCTRHRCTIICSIQVSSIFRFRMLAFELWILWHDPFALLLCSQQQFLS